MKRLGFLLPFMFSKAFVRFISAPNQENNSTIKKVMEHTAAVLLILRDSGGIGREKML